MRHPQQISIGMEKVEKLTHWAGLPLTASLLEMPLKTFAEPLGEKNMVTIKINVFFFYSETLVATGPHFIGLPQLLLAYISFFV